MHVARTNKANLLKVWLVALGVARGLVALALLMGAQPVFGQSVSGQPVGAQKLLWVLRSETRETEKRRRVL
jgi:hypothetical protein